MGMDRPMADMRLEHGAAPNSTGHLAQR
jgi:hypothetical protein